MISTVNRCRAPWADEMHGASQGRYVRADLAPDPERAALVAELMIEIDAWRDDLPVCVLRVLRALEAHDAGRRGGG